MKIKITKFGTRHFDSKFGGTKILDYTPAEVEKYVQDFIDGFENTKVDEFENKLPIIDGYASFCKLLPIVNFTDARVGSLPITLENYQYIRSGYSARRKEELPIFSRFFDLPIPAPKAKYLMLVLYSKEQIDKENKENPDEIFFEEFDADYGVVAILGQFFSTEEPMKPETMIRNALGISEGGSGVPLDREKYLKSVEFWSHNCTVK